MPRRKAKKRSELVSEPKLDFDEKVTDDQLDELWSDFHKTRGNTVKVDRDTLFNFLSDFGNFRARYKAFFIR